jgi:putative glycosyltransferase (TIGR04348 family)
MMRLLLITPFDPQGHTGNGVTALRWARLLRQLGHRVTVATEFLGQRADACIALHARRSAASIARWRGERDGAPLVVALSGTDLYVDLARGDRIARHSLALADRVVVLQPEGLARLSGAYRRKAVAIRQSAEPLRPRPRPLSGCFEISVLSGLRAVKDPLRAALAARRLPAQSRIRLTHVGPARDERLAARARAEAARNPRYAWHGAVAHRAARRLLARSRATVLSSRSEGGANVVAEAVAAGVPILASRIEGTVGQLGARYPGYFEVGDTAGLARLMARTESDASFRRRLQAALHAVAPRFRPASERAAWRRLLRAWR